MPKYQVTVTAVSNRNVALVKSLRIVANLSLGEAKAISEYLVCSLPCVLVAGINREVANHIVGVLREAGVEATTEESTISNPMLLCPAANERYVWTWLKLKKLTPES